MHYQHWWWHHCGRYGSLPRKQLLETSCISFFALAHCHSWYQLKRMFNLLPTWLYYYNGCSNRYTYRYYCLAVPTRFSCSFTYAFAQINQPEDEVLKMRIWKILWLLGFDYGWQTASFLLFYLFLFVSKNCCQWVKPKDGMFLIKCCSSELPFGFQKPNFQIR